MITFARRAVLSSLAAAAGLVAGCSVPDGSPIADRGLPLGSLVGRDAKVVVLSTPAGTRYDVLSLDGTLIASGLTASEVAAQVPGQDPRGAWADQPACGALMLADPGPRGLGD
jgi:hypothetical protein